MANFVLKTRFPEMNISAIFVLFLQCVAKPNEHVFANLTV